MKKIFLILAILLAVTANTALGESASTLMGAGCASDICAPLMDTAVIGSDVLPSADGTYDLGSSSYEWEDLYVDGTANLDAAVIGTLTYTKTQTLSIPAYTGRQGATATVGWVVTGVDKGLATLAASATADTLVIPITGLQIGDIVSAFKITGQVESGGNTATVDADLRKITPAAAGSADASIGAITQISKTADYAIADSKTLAAAETIASGETLYLLITATTAAATDVEISSVEVTITRTY